MLTFLIYSVFCVSLAWLTYLRPATGVVAALLMFAFEQWAQAHNFFFMQNNWLTNYLFLAIILLGVLRRVIRHGVVSPFPGVVPVLVIALYLFAFVSSSWSPAFDKALDIWAFQAPFLILMIVVTPMVISSTRDLGGVFFAYLLFAAPLALLLLLTVEWWGRYLVIEGLKSPFDANPNAIGNVGILIFMLSMVLEVDKSLHYNLHKIWRLIRWPLLLLGVALAIKAQSRGQLLAAGLAVLFAYWSKTERKDPKLVLGLTLFLGLVALAFTLIFESVIEDTERWSVEKMTADALLRFDASVVMLNAWSQDIVALMIGLGSAAAYSYTGLYVHVIPVEILTEQGVLGFTLFAAIIVLTLANVRKVLQRTEAGVEKSYFICLVGYFLIELVLCFKQGSLPLSPSLFFAVILIAHCARFKRAYMPKKDVEAESQVYAEGGSSDSARKPLFNFV